jgi:hypothetical protein
MKVYKVYTSNKCFFQIHLVRAEGPREASITAEQHSDLVLPVERRDAALAGEAVPGSYKMYRCEEHYGMELPSDEGIRFLDAGGEG